MLAMSNLLILLVSLCIVEAIHNEIEVYGMRQKIHWLKSAMNGKAHGHWPIHIDTRLKTGVLHLFILIFFGGISFVLIKSIDLSMTSLVATALIVLLLNYIRTTWKVNLFHDEIGQLIRTVKAGKNSSI